MRARPLAMAPIRAHRRALAALLFVLYLPACTSWQVAKASPEQLFEDDPPEKVRVTKTDGSEVELMSPVIRADTLVGTVKGDTVTAVSIPLSDVLLVEARKGDTGKTVLLVFGVVVGLLVLGGIAMVLDPPTYFGDPSE